jgi:Tfp pilus assembly protein PilO
MNGLLDKFNLRAQERRILVVVLTVVLLVINAIFVWPHYNDLALKRLQLDTSRNTLDKYRQEVARTPLYRSRLEALEKQGSAVLPAEQAIQLTRTVQNQALQSSVALTGTRLGTSSTTNQFFDEQNLTIELLANDQQLVDFLVALGKGDSMIRVRDLDLHPELPAQSQLRGKITVVASYQKKPKSAAPAPAPPAAVLRPTTNAPRASPSIPVPRPTTNAPPSTQKKS